MGMFMSKHDKGLNISVIIISLIKKIAMKVGILANVTAGFPMGKI